MRVLVCGGRNFANHGWITWELDLLHESRGPISLIIEGGAEGADRLAREWARARGVPSVTEHAEWEKYGSAAGPIRNRAMLRKGRPDLVLAFPGRKGTANMIAEARKAGVEVIVAVTVSPRPSKSPTP